MLFSLNFITPNRFRRTIVRTSWLSGVMLTRQIFYKKGVLCHSGAFWSKDSIALSPLSGVQIRLLKSGFSDTSDTAGKFTIKGKSSLGDDVSFSIFNDTIYCFSMIVSACTDSAYVRKRSLPIWCNGSGKVLPRRYGRSRFGRVLQFYQRNYRKIMKNSNKIIALFLKYPIFLNWLGIFVPKDAVLNSMCLRWVD